MLDYVTSNNRKIVTFFLWFQIFCQVYRDQEVIHLYGSAQKYQW